MSSNVFGKMSADRDEQRSRRAAAVAHKVKDNTERQKRLTVAISLTEADRDRIKKYAFDNGMTVSGVIQKWIRDYT